MRFADPQKQLPGSVSQNTEEDAAVVQGSEAPFQAGIRTWQHHSCGIGFEGIKDVRLSRSERPDEAMHCVAGSEAQ